MTPPLLSVVIPTYNRKVMLGKMIELLRDQTIPASEFEVVVVDDGGSDGTPEYIAALETPFRLHVVRQENGGAAKARNLGAREASGEMIVFMDDDLVPEPGMVESHRAALRSDRSMVVLGKLIPWGKGHLGPWNRWEDRIYARHYAAVESNKRPPSGRRLYSGNFSLWRDAFLNAGGFDETLQRGEDVELGFRLESRGARFTFSPGAAAYHAGYRTYGSWRRSSYLYGQSDVQLAVQRGHGQVLDEITGWFRRQPMPRRLMVKIGVVGGAPVRKSMEFGLRVIGEVTDKVGLRRLSHVSFSLIYGLNYWQGAADELGGAGALNRCVYGPPEYRASLAQTGERSKPASQGQR